MANVQVATAAGLKTAWSDKVGSADHPRTAIYKAYIICRAWLLSIAHSLLLTVH